VAWWKDCHNTVNKVPTIYPGMVPIDPRMQGTLCKTYMPAKTLKVANFKWIIVESMKKLNTPCQTLEDDIKWLKKIVYFFTKNKGWGPLAKQEHYTCKYSYK